MPSDPKAMRHFLVRFENGHDEYQAQTIQLHDHGVVELRKDGKVTLLSNWRRIEEIG